MRKHTSAADAPEIRVVIITMDSHVAEAVAGAREQLRTDLPGLRLSLHAIADWGKDPATLAACKTDIARADIVIANMLFMEEHIRAVLPDLQARREQCDAMVCCMSAGEVMKLTRMGSFKMDAKSSGPMAWLRKLRGQRNDKGSPSDGGARQMAILRTLPKVLRFIPGTAQDVRAYFLTLQHWLAGSTDNVANLVRLLVDRYAAGPRSSLRGRLKIKAPVEYPDNGLYHPRVEGRIAAGPSELPAPACVRGTVGLIVMRSYVLSGDTRHYDSVIASLESRGLRVLPAFASGLDSRPAIEKFFFADGKVSVDAVVSLAGFSLVGGPAFNDAKAAEEMLARLDVPYLSALPMEFQSVEQWQASPRGLTPVESTMMVAIPELDGATGPIVFAGRPGGSSSERMAAIPDRVEMLAARVDRLIRLRRTAVAERNVAIVLFNFPPNGGATGTAAYLSVFESLLRTLRAMKAEGYDVEVPAGVDELRAKILEGNAARFGAEANVHARIGADDQVRREEHLAEIEAQWGPSPGRQQSDGKSIFILGAQFGRVFVGVQPAFGYEGDPMRLLFESGFAPTHAFSAFYRYLREDFAAHVVLHFGTHGALEFMPGKQTGLSGSCWPERLIGDLPNLYLYAANNPSEGMIAKRRSAATLLSYLTPPVAQSGLYRGLLSLRESIEQFRALPPGEESAGLLPLIQAQAAELELAAATPAWSAADAGARVLALSKSMAELEATLIPIGLHVIGETPSIADRVEFLLAIAEGTQGARPPREAIEALVDGAEPAAALAAASLAPDEKALAAFAGLSRMNQLLREDHELPALMHALGGGFVRPAPGGDVMRNPDVLPTGRNVHGFDPFRIPSAFAVLDGAQQAGRLLRRHQAGGNPLPESIALVLWGTDNLKSGGGPIGQALALLGTRPRFDSYGRLSGAELIPLEELGRPRIDVVITLSGIFRDLLPMQTKLLAEAAFLAASADEPLTQNFVRKNALAQQKLHGCDLETAALRVFSNGDGTYGSNVNQLIDSGAWEDEDELAETYSRRKCFAYGRDGKPSRQQALMKSALANVQLAYQNLESVELGVTSVDHYFDTLGGISRSVQRERGASVPVYIGDQTRGGEGAVRTLGEQVALETRTRALNPKWHEEMLKHGAEGVRYIEAQISNTLGWSATTGQVEPWVYKQLSQTFVLDEKMRERLAQLNPKASVKLVSRLIEAHERSYWKPDGATLEALKRAGEELEDRLEGVGGRVAA